jgi:hypothetical protein
MLEISMTIVVDWDDNNIERFLRYRLEMIGKAGKWGWTKARLASRV